MDLPPETASSFVSGKIASADFSFESVLETFDSRAPVRCYSFHVSSQQPMPHNLAVCDNSSKGCTHTKLSDSSTIRGGIQG
jgi:hypothetical protein